MDLIEATRSIAAMAGTEEEIRIRIKGIDQILSADELQRLDTLPLEEQLLVSLCILGYEDTVTEAVREGRAVLGSEALALLRQIRDRLAGLSDEEHGRVQEILRAYGAPEEGTDTAKIELEIMKNGKTVEESCLYDAQDGKWILSGVKRE